MKLTVYRSHRSYQDDHPEYSGWTIGELFFDYEQGEGEKFHSFTLEDEDRWLYQSDPLDHIVATKVKGRTCIPYGVYEVVFVMSPSRKVKTLRLQLVPGYQGILIHSGNTPEHTLGCLMVGFSADPEKGRIYDSNRAEADLTRKVVYQLERGNRCFIHIVDKEGRT